MTENIIDKLKSRGLESLEDRELLTLLLSYMAEERQVEQYVEAIYAECQTLGNLRRTPLQRLRMVGGMGQSRAQMLVAAMELGRRVALLDAESKTVIKSNDDVVNMMRPQLQELEHEECWVIYLSSSNSVIEKMCVSRGGVQSTVVDVRQVMKRAVELLASQMILVHNHPSGSPQASQIDKDLTKRVKEAAQIFDIKRVDHVIIASNGSFSFRAAGLL